MTTNPELNQEVVGSIGYYVVGRIGTVVDLDLVKNRAQVQWLGETKTWVSFKSIELTSVPYKIIRTSNGFPKYYKL